MSKLDLTPYERRQLRQQLHDTSDARLYQRLLAVLEVERKTREGSGSPTERQWPKRL